MRSSEDKQENLKKSIEIVGEAAGKGADLACFPEFQMAFSSTNQSAMQLASLDETIKGNLISKLAVAAKKNKIGVVATIYEKSGRPHRVHDTAVMISPAGKVSSVYRKLHLYNALGFKESEKLVQGKTIVKPERTNAGSVGLLICYDLRFPELSRILTVKGADVLVAPSAWVAGEMKEEHWQTMVKARAIENGSDVEAAGQDGNIYCRRSIGGDPIGEWACRMKQREGVEVREMAKSPVPQ